MENFVKWSAQKNRGRAQAIPLSFGTEDFLILVPELGMYTMN